MYLSLKESDSNIRTYLLYNVLRIDLTLDRILARVCTTSEPLLQHYKAKLNQGLWVLRLVLVTATQATERLSFRVVTLTRAALA